MKVVFGGVRGSYPTADADHLRYGGDTTCIAIEGTGGERLIIDAGTGVRRLSASLGRASDPLTVLFTHYHLDHIAGLPLLGALYQRGREVTLAAPLLGGRAVADVLPNLFGPPFWPVGLHHIGAQLRFETLTAAPLVVGRLEVRWCAVEHQGGCVAYRVDEREGGALVFATDIEWAAAGEDRRREFLRFCRTPSPASLLCFDGAYTDAEYAGRRGWGHSTWSEAVAVARAAGVAQLRVIHHAPEHDDAALDAIEHQVRAAVGEGAALAREGEELVVRPL
ncbi:MAG: MBL fold metallo-hydrolase [Kiritimatiellae bacterium]|nr:MBL fold metallo-hydrolase [Kiritimatiellia bacterium]